MGRRGFRIRIWMLMALAAVSAVAMGGWRSTREFRRLKLLSEEYAQRASRHAEYETVLKGIQTTQEAGPRRDDVSHDPAMTREGYYSPLTLSRIRDLLAYHTSLRQKYERAARYPWLPVEPDPPEPG